MLTHPDIERGGASTDVSDVIEVKALQQLARAHAVLDDDLLGRLEVVETAALQTVLARLAHPDPHVLPVLRHNNRAHVIRSGHSQLIHVASIHTQPNYCLV